jgi:hypothetical protein
VLASVAGTIRRRAGHGSAASQCPGETLDTVARTCRRVPRGIVVYPPPAPYQQPTPPKRRSPLKIVLLSIAGVFGFLLVLGVVGAAFGLGKQPPATAAAGVTTSAASVRPPVRSLGPAQLPAIPTPSKAPTTPAARTTKAAAPATSASSSCALPDDRDLFVRYIVPGLQPEAQQLGEADLANCTTTLSMLEQTSPNEAGYCTQVGYVDQNPGYNADATPAAPLKKTIEEIGLGC